MMFVPQNIDGLAYVCSHLDDLRNLLDDTAPLDRLLAAVRAGADPGEPMRDLHRAVQAAGDALGVLGQPNRGVAGTPGLPPVRVELVYLCPSRACTRHEWAEARCEVNDAPLRRERLP